MFSLDGCPQAIFQRVCTNVHLYQQQFLLFQPLSLPVLFIWAIQVGLGQHFIFISIPIVGKFVGCDWCLNFLSFLLVAEILLFQFFLKVILPTGNLLSSFLSLPYLFIVISPWGLLSVTFAHTSQPSLWATPAGAAVTFVGVLCGSCGSPPPVDSRGPWFEFSALPHPYPPWD